MSVTPPYGQGPYGGFPQGPPATDSSTKPALANSMAIATELWVLIILAQCVIFGGQYQAAFDAADEVAKDMPDGNLPDGAVWAVYVIVGLALAAVFAGLTWLTRSGRNWARLVLGFLSFYLVVQTVSSFFIEDADHWTMIPTVIGGVAALGAGVLLMHRDSDTYCKDMAAWRKSHPQTHLPYGPPGQYPPSGQYPQSGQYPKSGQYPPSGQYPYPNPYGQYPQQPYYGPQGGFQQPAHPDQGTSPDEDHSDPRTSGNTGSDTGERK